MLNKLTKNLLAAALMLTSSTLLATTPLTLSTTVEYDSNNSAVLSTKASRVFDTDKAVAIEQAFGKNTVRINTTYAARLADKHMWKVTNDFLYQHKEFDFGEAFGKHTESVYQDAIGMAYHYDVRGTYLRGFEVASYFSYAPSVSSTAKRNPSLYFPSEPGTYTAITFNGRLAGSKTHHQEVSLEVSPVKNSLLTIGADYEQVAYATKWHTTNSPANYGWYVKYEHVLLPWLKASSNYSFMGGVQSYGNTVSVLLPSPSKVQLELIGNLLFDKDSAGARRRTFAGVTMQAAFWSKASTYDSTYSKKSLESWVTEPVVRMRDVMVTPEVRYSKGTVRTYLNAPTGAFVRSRSPSDTGYVYNGVAWDVLTPTSKFNLDEAIFVEARLYISSGIVYAHYRDSKDSMLSLKYAGSKKPIDYVGSNWEKDSVTGAWKCEEAYASACKFKVEL